MILWHNCKICQREDVSGNSEVRELLSFWEDFQPDTAKKFDSDYSPLDMWIKTTEEGTSYESRGSERSARRSAETTGKAEGI